jgi:hypothetical protein
MQKCYRRLFRADVLALCAVGLVGCSTEQAQTPGRQVALGLVRARSDTGVELHVVLPRDTVSARERGPVPVFYYVVNGPSKTAFHNSPHGYLILVTNWDGTPAHAVSEGAPPTGTWGPQVDMVLPAGAWLGQVEDLRCVRRAGYAELPSGQAPECLLSYPLDVPGRYRVIVMYHDETRENGRALQDTAVLVVR